MSINRSPSLLLLFKSNSHRFFPTSTSRIGSTLTLPSTRSRTRTRAVSTFESGPSLRCYSSTSYPKSRPSSNPNRRRLPSLILSTSLAITLFFTFDHYLNHRIAQRNIYTIATGALIAADFKFKFDSTSPESIASIHSRSASRLLQLCESNGGLYTKIAQAVGTQAALLPKPYQALSKLLDGAEEMKWEVARKVLEEDLGGREKVEEIFFSIDEKPLACASIAQVHHGYLRDPKTNLKGKECAIKIQRPLIRTYARNDLWCFRLMLKIHEFAFGLPLSYFGQYITDQIQDETLFEKELENAKRARLEVMNDRSKEIRETCYVPQCFEEWSTSRVLVMEFIGKPLVKMTDKDGIEEMGLNVKRVCRSVMELSAAQIFDHGHLQADGHPGNVLVRPHPSGRQGDHQIILLDHGLYVTLSPTFKKQYAELWRAIFEVDMKVLREIIVSWGMEKDVAELFASATLMRPWKGERKEGDEKKLYKVKTSNGEGNGEEEVEKEWKDLDEDQKKKIRWENERKRGMEFKEKINNFLVSVELVPKELIFVGRAMRIFQANNQALGSPVNRINILAKHASNALISSRTSSLWRVFFPARTSFSPTTSSTSSKSSNLEVLPPFTSRLSEWFQERIAFLKFRLTLLVVDFVWESSNILYLLKRTGIKTTELLGLKEKGKKEDDNRGFEDDLEEQMKKMANDELGIELNDSSFSG